MQFPAGGIEKRLQPQLSCELLEAHELRWARQWVEWRFLGRASQQRTSGLLQAMLVKLYRFYSALNYLDSETGSSLMKVH